MVELPELPYTCQLKCRICGYKSKGFQESLSAMTEMAHHLVACLRMWENDKAEHPSKYEIRE